MVMQIDRNVPYPLTPQPVHGVSDGRLAADLHHWLGTICRKGPQARALARREQQGLHATELSGPAIERLRRCRSERSSPRGYTSCCSRCTQKQSPFATCTRL